MAYSAGGESSSSSGTSDSTPPWKYDVFLSFAGKDTRLNFTGHLDAAFTRSGIKTFMDDVGLEQGEDIKRGLFQAIKDSLCAVLIISKNYAGSLWCLEELQKILESQKTLGRRVIPIFYNVNPSDVKHLQGSFGEAFAKHEKKFIEDKEKVKNWKKVFSEIGNISGEDTRGKHEADLIQNIVGDVWSYLSSKLPSYDDNLVGIDSRLGDMIPFLEIGLDDKRFVGIWGMGGLGKTTLARVVSEKLYDKFEICCFLANVRETLLQREGVVSLQNRLLSHLKIKGTEISDAYEGMKMIRKLLCNKKVLLVLDDLDDTSQLKNLVGSPDWFVIQCQGQGFQGLIRLDALDCNSMEPLSDRQLCNLVSSLDHEYRGRTKYVISDKEDDDIPLELKDVELECLPLRDFFAFITGSDIPSWFTKYTSVISKDIEINVNIPGYFRDSEWSVIVVCLLVSGCSNTVSINWSSKAAEDGDFVWKDWAHYTDEYPQNNHLCIMVLELNEETCWKHLTAHNNTLHIQLSAYLDNPCCDLLGCGWRVICSKEWCTPNHFNHLPSPREVNLPCRVLERFLFFWKLLI